MQLAASLVGAVGLAINVVLLWYYKHKSSDLERRLAVVESAAKARAALNQELRNRLAEVLKAVKAGQAKEAAREAAQAGAVTDAGGASDLLNDIVRSHR